MVGEYPTQTSLPGDDLKPAWRVACVAYRKVRQAGELDQPAWLAARAAIQFCALTSTSVPLVRKL